MNEVPHQTLASILLGHRLEADMLRMQARDDFSSLRQSMVERQLRARGVRDPGVLAAMGKLPRHEFVPRAFSQLSYSDAALPIGNGQTLHPPFMVATMLEALELKGYERVLEVGTGSGYQSALLAECAGEVVSLEIVPELAYSAAQTLRRLGYADVQIVVGDGSFGWPARAPYDAIIVATGSSHVPAPLLDQLADDGRLVIAVGDPQLQRLKRIRKHQNVLETEQLTPCVFFGSAGQHGIRRSG